jgi:F0F1-type ATP synthase delta subunit
LTTAVELEDEDLRQLCHDLTFRLGRKVLIDIKIDKGVLGGAVIKKDNYILDYSLATKLAKLSEEWKKSVQAMEE